MSTTTVAHSDEDEPLLGSPSDPSPSAFPSRHAHHDRPVTNDGIPDERTALLSDDLYQSRGYSDQLPTQLPRSTSDFSRYRSGLTGRKTPGHRTPNHRASRFRHHARVPSWGARLATAMQSSWHGELQSSDLTSSKLSFLWDERMWYDQYTSTDWVQDSIADNFRLQGVRARKGIRGKLAIFFDASQGWILAAIVGVLTAFVAYFVDISENAIFDIKEGYCVDGWHKSRRHCCLREHDCPLWRTWGDVLQLSGIERETVDLLFYVAFVVVFALASCALTLTTKTVVPSNVTVPAIDENLGHEPSVNAFGLDGTAKLESHAKSGHRVGRTPPPVTYYPAAGSGVAEVKVILSGFVLHGYLGVKTLIIKTFGLILSVASGLCLGKEGPFVHIATCIGNVACRVFDKYRLNDGKRREVLSASAASGVAVAFGAPLAGTLFSLEEVSYYFPPKTLFRTFFCCIVAALSLKFLDPYNTGQIVIFEVRYSTDWYFWEIFGFMSLGIAGGVLGALFIKASRLWARSIRRISFVRRMPLLEVAVVAVITGAIQFWNPQTKQPVTQLLSDLASPCKDTNRSTDLCPNDEDEVLGTIKTLALAFLIKSCLTTITFGIKVPAGIYVPAMVVGGLMGRLVGHILQYATMKYPNNPLWAECSLSGGPESCITPGVYALVAAGATMCGVTRLSVTLVVILFELTGSLDHVLPFSLAILCAKWTGDALEPLSIYDLLTEMNHYPFLDNKSHPIFTSQLLDITPRVRGQRIIDISRSPSVPVTKIRTKLRFLQSIGEIDGGLPIIRDGVLVGMLPAPDLEFALDKLNEQHPDALAAATGDEGNGFISATRDRSEVYCLISPDEGHILSSEDDDDDDDDEDGHSINSPRKIFDISPYVDPAPVALDVHSPMDLVYQCFVKLGLRYICVLRDGQYAGMVHKKAFVKYIRELETGKER